jgi:LCP family protein required for cell wall assembly
LDNLGSPDPGPSAGAPLKRLYGVALMLIVGAIAVLGVALLREAAGTRRNLAAMVVTPAPSPSPPPGAAPLLTLPTVGPAAASAAGPVTVLLLGTDRRPGEEVTPRSDAILLVRVDPERRRVAVLSLPRDLWVSIPGHGQNRLNAAYLWGERDGPPGGGMALTRAVVAQTLGVPVDYAAAVDFRGFAALVDTVGGVTVDVERPLVDPRFPTLDRGVRRVSFEPGPQAMDGATALTYARIRHPDSDFERGRRQQAVLIALAEAVRDRGYLANLLAAERLSGALVGYVQTDMPPERMVALAWALRDLDAASVERYALREEEVVFGVGLDRVAQTPRPGVLERYARLLLEGE